MIGTFKQIVIRVFLVFISILGGASAYAIYVTNVFGAMTILGTVAYAMASAICFGWACFIGRLGRKKV